MAYVKFIWAHDPPHLFSAFVVFQRDPGSEPCYVAVTQGAINHLQRIQPLTQKPHSRVDFPQSFLAINVVAIFRAITIGRRRWMDLSLGYPDQPGSSYLRDEIGKLYESAPALNVCSPAEGIFLAMTALLEPGDHVVATSPCYQSLTEVARSVGAQITPWTP